MRLAAGLHPDLLGELTCSPDYLATMGLGEGMGETGEGRELVGSRNITLKSNNFLQKEKEQGTNCKLFRRLKQ